MDLESAASLGGTGAMLLVISSLGIIGTLWLGMLALSGMILVLIAVKNLAVYYDDKAIFRSTLYGFVITIAGGVAFVITLVVSILLALVTRLNLADWTIWWEEIQSVITVSEELFAILGSMMLVLGVTSVFAIIAAMFYRQSLISLAVKSGNRVFSTASSLLLIGSILTIVAIGFILIWISLILIAVGFFSIRTKTTNGPLVGPQEL